MTKHDKAVLSICRNFLKKGEKKIQIGRKVVSHRKILDILQKEYPTRVITISKS